MFILISYRVLMMGPKILKFLQKWLRISVIPDQYRNGHHIDAGNQKSGQDTVQSGALIAKGIDDNSHSDIGVESIAGLAEGTCLVSGNWQFVDAHKADSKDRNDRENGSKNKLPATVQMEGRTANFVKQHCREEERIDKPVGNTGEFNGNHLPAFEQNAAAEKQQNWKEGVEDHGLVRRRGSRALLDVLVQTPSFSSMFCKNRNAVRL